jgi:hypothetical protein
MKSRRFTAQCLRASNGKDTNTSAGRKAAALRHFNPVYVGSGSKTGKAQNEQMFSGLAPIADMNEPCRHVASVPTSVACDGDGVPVFERLRGRRDDRHVILFAFDLLELNGKDLRREPIEVRKAELARLLSTAPRGLQ